jgi:ABC-2 type transport system ATP-binding protein
MLEPESGQFRIDGISSEYPDQIRQKIGVLPESIGFPKQMTGLEYLTYYGQLYGRTAASATEKAHVLLGGVGLQQRAKSLIGTYSRGMKQRLGIARALVNDPVIVFLDEPTLGLDLRGRQELLDLVQRIARERNAGVVLSTHLISEVENICDDVLILDRGKVVARGSVSQLIDRVQKNIILKSALRLQVPPLFVTKAREVLETMPNILNINQIGEPEGSLRLELLASDDGDLAVAYDLNNKILSALLRAKIPILCFEVEGGRLQDIFMHLTEDVIQ